MTNGSSQLQQEQEKLHWQPRQLQVRDRLQSAPMTSTPSLSGPQSPKLGDNVECNGAARRRRELWCCATCSGGIRIIAGCLHDQQSRARTGSIDRQADRQQGGRELGKAEREAGKWVRPDTLNSPLQNEKNLVTHTGNWNRTHTDTRTRTHTHSHTQRHTQERLHREGDSPGTAASKSNGLSALAL